MSGTIRVHDDLLLAACKHTHKLLTIIQDFQILYDTCVYNSTVSQTKRSFNNVPCTAEALAAQATEENYAKGLIYPPFTNIRKISANIAANVAAKSYELGKLAVQN